MPRSPRLSRGAHSIEKSVPDLRQIWFHHVALSYSRYGRQRETELIGLGSPTTRAAAWSLGIRLITFRDLG